MEPRTCGVTCFERELLRVRALTRIPPAGVHGARERRVVARQHGAALLDRAAPGRTEVLQPLTGDDALVSRLSQVRLGAVGHRSHAVSAAGCSG